MNSVGGAIDQIGKRFGVNVLRTPVPHHHRNRSATAQRFALRQIGNVQQVDLVGRRLGDGTGIRCRRHHPESRKNQVAYRGRYQLFRNENNEDDEQENDDDSRGRNGDVAATGEIVVHDARLLGCLLKVASLKHRHAGSCLVER